MFDNDWFFRKDTYQVQADERLISRECQSTTIETNVCCLQSIEGVCKCVASYNGMSTPCSANTEKSILFLDFALSAAAPLHLPRHANFVLKSSTSMSKLLNHSSDKIGNRQAIFI